MCSCRGVVSRRWTNPRRAPLRKANGALVGGERVWAARGGGLGASEPEIKLAGDGMGSE